MYKRQGFNPPNARASDTLRFASLADVTGNAGTQTSADRPDKDVYKRQGIARKRSANNFGSQLLACQAVFRR